MASHPYFPQDAVLSGDVYTENDMSVTQLISLFAIGISAVLSVGLLRITRISPKLSNVDIGLILWFVMCKSASHQSSVYTNMFQRAQFTSFSKASSSYSTLVLQACRPSLPNCGKSMLYLIPDTCSQIHWCYVVS